MFGGGVPKICGTIEVPIIQILMRGFYIGIPLFRKITMKIRWAAHPGMVTISAVIMVIMSGSPYNSIIPLL